MYNGLRSYKHLGLNWCCVVASFASIASFCLADWTSEDLTYILEAIDGVESEVYEVAVQCRSINYFMPNVLQGIEDANSELDTISSYLNSINTKLSNFPTSHIFDEILWDLYSIEFDLEKREKRQSRFEAAATNQLNNVVWNTEATVDRLDLLLNYVTNQTVAAAFPTNLPAALVLRDLVPGVAEDYMREYFYKLYGRYPQEEEFYDFIDTYYLTNSQYQLQDWYSRIAWREYLNVEDWTGDIVGDTFWEVYPNDTSTQKFGEMYYLEYNTHDVTEYVASIMGVLTNGFEHLPGLQTSYDEEGNPVTTLDSDSTDAVGDLADSFTSTFGLESEVDATSTNEIENLEDQGYSEALSGISRDTVLQDITADLASSVSALMQESQSYLIPSESADSFTLDFGSMSIFGSSGKPVQFTLTRAPQLYFRIIRVVTAVLKIIVALGAMYAIFHRVTSLDLS